MSVRGARLAVAAFFLAYLLAVTWPVGSLFGNPEPFVLGLPFSFFWPALWIIMGGAALALLDRVEDRGGGVEGPEGEGAGPTGRGGPEPARPDRPDTAGRHSSGSTAKPHDERGGRP